jgi:hypothetical protein
MLPPGIGKRIVACGFIIAVLAGNFMVVQTLIGSAISGWLLDGFFLGTIVITGGGLLYGWQALSQS